MLSNLASYFLGYGESSSARNESTSNADSNLRLTAVETEEDDWIMVEKTYNESEIGKHEEGDDDRPRDWSRSGSTSSLPCLSLEESWFVTPPPCFTSTGPVTVETSPLENLLIEHPSMSVYHGRGLTAPGGRTVPHRARSLSPRSEPALEEPQPRADPPAPHHNYRSPLHPNYYRNIQRQTFSVQKQKNKSESQSLKGKQLEKCNKVKEVNKRNKRPRRSDRQKNHSGANNNRKC